MGGHFSKSSKALRFRADRVNDSIRSMFAKEERLAQKKGVRPCGYRPATPHPLVERKKNPVCDEDNRTEASIGSSLQMVSDKDKWELTKKRANENCSPRPHLCFLSGSC
jgi:hypothetical protein